VARGRDGERWNVPRKMLDPSTGKHGDSALETSLEESVPGGAGDAIMTGCMRDLSAERDTYDPCCRPAVQFLIARGISYEDSTRVAFHALCEKHKINPASYQVVDEDTWFMERIHEL
jgi:hypothetical protein